MTKDVISRVLFKQEDVIGGQRFEDVYNPDSTLVVKYVLLGIIEELQHSIVTHLIE